MTDKLEARVGEPLKISFNSGAMPYSWNAKSDDAFEISRKTVPNLKGFGAAAFTEFTLVASKAGTFDVTFELTAPHAKKAAEARTFKIEVKR